MEILTNLLELLQNDPGGFFTTILAYAGTTTVGGFSFWAILQLGRGLWRKLTHAEAKLKATLSNIMENRVMPLKADILALKESLEQNYTNTLQGIQTQFTSEITQLKGHINELLAQSTALAGTVLNTSDLQLKYKNLETEFLLLKQKAETSAKQSYEQAKEQVFEIAEDIKPEVEQIVAEVKKIKLKRK